MKLRFAPDHDELASPSRRVAITSLAVVPLLPLIGCSSSDSVAPNADSAPPEMDSRTPPPKKPHEVSVENFVKAYNDHDIDGVLSFFAEGASITLNAAPLADREALRAFFIEYGVTNGTTSLGNASMSREITYFGDETLVFMGRIYGASMAPLSGFAATPPNVRLPFALLCQFDAEDRCSVGKIFLNWGSLLRIPA